MTASQITVIVLASTKERNMGECEFEVGGVVYIAVDAPPVKPCSKCSFFINDRCAGMLMNAAPDCFGDFRVDGRNVIFVEKK